MDKRRLRPMLPGSGSLVNEDIELGMKRIAIMTAALVIGFAGLTNQAQAELKVGDKAPEFSLPGSDGKTYKLSDFAGKQAIVIAWYPKAFTGG